MRRNHLLCWKWKGAKSHEVTEIFMLDIDVLDSMFVWKCRDLCHVIFTL